jgi:hypothetical protein
MARTGYPSPTAGPVAAAAVASLLVLMGGLVAGLPGFALAGPPPVPARTLSAGLPLGPDGTGSGIWVNLTAGLPNTPGPRFASAGGWDGALGETVLFGGFSPTIGPLRTTWAFSDGSWHSIGPSNLTPGNAPSSRFGASAAYDPALGSLILFGGRDSAGGLLNDTWSFANGNWSNWSSRFASAPAPRVNASMAFDPGLNELVLFGGRSPYALFNDTWEFNGSSWSSVGSSSPNSTNTPPTRYGATLVYSAANSDLVLFGGTGFSAGTYPLLGDTWTFGSSGWAPVHPASSPSPRMFTAAAELPSGTPILFGGLGATGPLGGTWEFTGSTWTNETGLLGAPPANRSGAFAAPVSVGNGTGYVLVFGGLGNTTALDDTGAVGANAIVVTAGAATPSALDTLQTTTLTVVAFGPTTTLTYAWSGLPAGCTSADSATISCTPTQVGHQTASVTISDGSSAGPITQTITFVVNSPPSVSAVLVTPFPFVLGSGNVSITVHATGGTGLLHYRYTNLPPGCLTNDTAFFTCAPNVLGSWTVNATATDATNDSASQNATVVVVATGPSHPSRIVQAIESPLGATAVIVGIGLVLMLVYTLRRRSQVGRKAVPPAPAAPPPAPPPESPPPAP